MTPDTHGQHLLENVENWTLSGGTWRIASISKERAVVELCACTGEPMERLESRRPHRNRPPAHHAFVLSELTTKERHT